MPKYAVASMHYYDNEIRISFVEAGSWREALSRHIPGALTDVSVDSFPEDMEEAKNEADSNDWTFEVKEIPEEQK